ncbi:MAG: AbrB/MazE/SpoVT family DNA-binding domain-containing protein [Firmicutes bacterium]|nr:AbrB/MazE/SpoVT family DNA-binding domain-containing protein [Bacillota bacterium]
MSQLASVSSKGWIVIPRHLRERYKILPRSKVLITESDRGLLIVPLPPDPAGAFRGMLKEHQLVQELIKARKEESGIEELRAGQLRGADLLSE